MAPRVQQEFLDWLMTIAVEGEVGGLPRLVIPASRVFDEIIRARLAATPGRPIEAQARDWIGSLNDEEQLEARALIAVLASGLDLERPTAGHQH